MPETPPFRAEHDLAVQSPEQLIAAIDLLQHRITELEQSLERQDRLATLGTIAGLIAHEFNNILTPVMSYAQMALAAPDDRELASKALQKAADGADRAGQVAGAILGLVRRDHAPGSAGGQQRCNVAAAVNRALACLARPLDKDMIQFRSEIDSETEVAARGVAVEHVLLNLIINARSAMLPRGGSLTVRSMRNAPVLGPRMVTSWSRGSEHEWPIAISEREIVVIAIKDTGRGMAAERMSRLFNVSGISEKPNINRSLPDAHASTIPVSGDRRGHGLGMLVCKRLVEDAGGALVVESEPGRGTTVYVVWPAAVGE